MRPIELQITGLNSFRERQTIQFEPLLAEGLFGIFGPTGSGKSSILDAITLALYGEVKRAPKGKGGIINIREKSCSVSFTFDVIVDGVRKRYTVERLLEREKKKGGITTKRARLSEHRDGERIPIAEKEKEVDGRPQEPGKIQELIGIGADDFLRAVILPQGAFSNLLNLKPAERGEVMQRLFGLHDLGERLRSQISLRGTEVEMLRAGQDGRISELRAYDEAALELCRTVLEEARRETERAGESFELAERRLRDGEELYRLLSEQQLLAAGADERIRSRERMRELGVAIDRAERSRLVQPALAAAEDAARRFRTADERYKLSVTTGDRAAKLSREAMERLLRIQGVYDAEYDPLCETISALKHASEKGGEAADRRARIAGLDAACGDAERLKRSADERNTSLAGTVHDRERRIAGIDERRKMLRVPQEERARLERLGGLLLDRSRLVESLRTKSGELDLRRRELDELGRTIERTATDETAARERVTLLQSSIESARTLRTTLDTERTALLDRWSAIEGTLKVITEIENQIAQQQAELEQQGIAMKRLEDERRTASLDTDTVLERRRQARERFESARQTLADAERRALLSTLAKELEPGAPCPLCGSPEHPEPHVRAGHDAEAIAKAQHALSSCELVLQQIEDQLTALSERVLTRTTSLDAARTAVAAIESRIADNRERISAEIIALGLNLPIISAERLRILRENIQQQGRATKQRLDAASADLLRLDAELREAQDRSRDAAAGAAAFDSQRRERVGAIEQLDREVEGIGRLISELDVRLSSESGGLPPESIEAERSALADRDREAEEIETQLAADAEELRRLREELAAAASDLIEATRSHDAALAQRAQLAAELRRIEEEARAIVDRLPEQYRTTGDIGALLRRAEERRDALRRDHDVAKQEYEHAHTEARMREAESQAEWKALCAEEVHRDTMDRQLASLLLQHGISDAADVTRNLLDLDDLRALKDESSTIERGLHEAERRIEELEMMIAGRTIAGDELTELRSAAERTRSERDRSIAMRGAAEQSYATCIEKNDELRRALAEQQEVEGRAATIEQLRRYLTGNGFVNYLADERLAEVCRRASIQLESLTGGRLELCTRTSDGFYIRDHGNGGGERSTSSLSGGETFLVSLSLALALSDTIQLGKAPLEFFFLDEGFGTLDQELLETVLDSLDRLRSQHRAIGVISHVGALRERINRRLVIAPANDARGSMVTYEIA